MEFDRGLVVVMTRFRPFTNLLMVSRKMCTKFHQDLNFTQVIARTDGRTVSQPDFNSSHPCHKTIVATYC